MHIYSSWVWLGMNPTMNSRIPPLRAELRKILIIKPSSLGDIIHGLPVLDAFGRRYPGAEIHWVVARGFHDILQGHPLIRKLWIIDKSSWKKPGMAFQTGRELKKLAAGLRGEGFDLVVDLQGLLRSAAIALFAGTGERAGFASAREGAKYFYKYRIETPREMHAVEKNMRVARFFGCGADEPRFSFPPLHLPPALSRALPSEYAALAPSAGTLVKRWPPARFAELAARLPIASIIVGGPGDAALGREIASLSNGRALSLAGKTSLKELAAILRGARFLVCPDTGPMHIAAALGVPVFAIFGPTSPVRTGPYGNIHTIIRKDIPCSPCYKRKPCEDWRCMREVSPAEVLEIILSREAGNER